MTGKVIELRPKPPGVDEEHLTFFACGSCRNKTYTLTLDRHSEYPLLKCAACGHKIGRMGWYYDEPADEEGE